jgi:hypothetical protein
MRLGRRAFALLVGLWGVALALLAGQTAASGCPLGSCPACWACFRPPGIEAPAEEDRLA